MDLFGKKEAEDALEAVKNVSRRVEDLESHLNAVDSAVQELAKDSDKLVEEEQRELEEFQEFHKEREKNQERIKQLEEKVDKLIERQRRDRQKINKIMDSGLLDVLETTKKSVKSNVENTRRMRSDMKDLEDRVEELENQLYLEINKRDFDFQQKLDERRYEEEKDSFKQELKKLRASINFLADEIDKKDELEID